MRFPPLAVIGGSSPDQGQTAPGLPLGEITCLGFQTTFACRAGMYESLMLLAQRKPGKSPGAILHSPGDYSSAFPGCRASGLAAFSGRARRIRPSIEAVSSKQQREESYFDEPSNIRKCRVQGGHPLVEVWWQSLQDYAFVMLCPWGVSFTRYPAAARASRSSSLRFQFFSLRAMARSSAIC